MLKALLACSSVVWVSGCLIPPSPVEKRFSSELEIVHVGMTLEEFKLQVPKATLSHGHGDCVVYILKSTEYPIISLYGWKNSDSLCFYFETDRLKRWGQPWNNDSILFADPVVSAARQRFETELLRYARTIGSQSDDIAFVSGVIAVHIRPQVQEYYAALHKAGMNSYRLEGYKESFEADLVHIVGGAVLAERAGAR
jgi:hypothetical protein